MRRIKAQKKRERVLEYRLIWTFLRLTAIFGETTIAGWLLKNRAKGDKQ